MRIHQPWHHHASNSYIAVLLRSVVFNRANDAIRNRDAHVGNSMLGTTPRPLRKIGGHQFGLALSHWQAHTALIGNINCSLVPGIGMANNAHAWVGQQNP
jgi:hypothetical protein